MEHLQAEHPEDAGIRSRIPDSSHTEGAELLANEARNLLRVEGFTDQQIEEWAHTYIADERTGDVASFLEWIGRQESGHSARRG